MRMRDFSYKMQQMRDLAAKTKEGSLDDQKKNAPQKKCQRNIAPGKFHRFFGTYDKSDKNGQCFEKNTVLQPARLPFFLRFVSHFAMLLKCCHLFIIFCDCSSCFREFTKTTNKKRQENENVSRFFCNL